ncbi:MAG: prepilin-type N-terminal cleavage/methylation domain-containing protein [Phycisphaerales bacterium]
MRRHQFRRLRRSRGHSLVEILIAVAIIVIVAGLIASALLKLRSVLKSWKKASGEPPAAAVIREA